LNYFLSIISFVCFLNIDLSKAQSNVFSYNKNNQSGEVVKNFFTINVTNSYPLTGIYSPTMWAKNITEKGTGFCNYIKFNCSNKILAGQQYTCKAKIKVHKSYSNSKYYKSHFGIGFTPINYKSNWEQPDNWGLLDAIYFKLDNLIPDSVNQVTFDFRALCNPENILIGVYGDEKEVDSQEAFRQEYKFQVYDLEITNAKDLNAPFQYLCNKAEANKDKKVKFENDTSVYFKQGSFEIDTSYNSLFALISQNTKASQSMFRLEAYTNKSGSDNNELGKKRIEAVLALLMKYGIDSARIEAINYAETKSNTEFGSHERRVKISLLNDMLFQKYYSNARENIGNSIEIVKSNFHKWLKLVPPDLAIFSIFDCNNLASLNKESHNYLLNQVNNKFYKNQKLKFELDSLWCEDQKGRTLEMYILRNYPSTKTEECKFDIDSNHQLRLEQIADDLFKKHGFVLTRKFGRRAAEALPYIIIHSNNKNYQEKYLPIFKKACEELKMSWVFYASLYDKLSMRIKGYQRYGTQYEMDNMRNIKGLSPLENKEMINEWRRQVGLSNLSDE
jgi:outer membrane protein OmpA-like peptidoglycan-associated protein